MSLRGFIPAWKFEQSYVFSNYDASTVYKYGHMLHLILLTLDDLELWSVFSLATIINWTFIYKMWQDGYTSKARNYKNNFNFVRMNEVFLIVLKNASF